MADFDQNQDQIFQRSYRIALLIVLLLCVVSHLVIQSVLHTQDRDALLINLSGRQRMLSQRITKLALKVYYQPQNLEETLAELRVADSSWAASHYTLYYGNHSLAIPSPRDDELLVLFGKITPHFEKMHRAAQEILAQPKSPQAALDSIQAHESAFLSLMDRITFRFEQLAEHKLNRLSWLEIIILLLTLLTLFLELRYVFRPAYLRLKNYISQIKEKNALLHQQNQTLQVQEQELQNQLEELRVIQNMLEKQQQETLRLNHTLEQRVEERTQELQKRNEQIIQYNFINSHQLRRPLANMMGLVKLIVEEPSAKQKDLFCQHLERATLEMDEIIHQINEAVEK